MTSTELRSVVDAYLWHGYVPTRPVPDWLNDVCDTTGERSDYSVNGAVARLDDLFDRLTARYTTPHVVPLSGGWDSRLILAALRDRTDRVIAVTLGCPGQLDYEIGARVAEAAGVEHVPVALDHFQIEWDALKATAHHATWTYMPDALYLSIASRAAADLAGPGARTWSGFLGDPLTGGHYCVGFDDEDTSRAHEEFARTQHRSARDLGVSQPRPGFYARPRDRWNAFGGEREWLDFSVRQRCCIAPIVLGKEWRGWSAEQGLAWGEVPIIAPFADLQWAAYWLHAPRSLHEGQQLYRKMAQARYPALFDLPSKHSWGLPSGHTTRQRLRRMRHALRNRAHSYLPRLPIRSRIADNYLDFQHAFRKREDYVHVIEKAIGVLKQREAVPWLDLDRIWREHYRGQRDHASSLQVLLGLAVNLEVADYGN